jgi:hypothetical protein
VIGWLVASVGGAIVACSLAAALTHGVRYLHQRYRTRMDHQHTGRDPQREIR